jgi:hypothetical protein
MYSKGTTGKEAEEKLSKMKEIIFSKLQSVE